MPSPCSAGCGFGYECKKLIESIVIGSVEESDDDAIFAYLSETRPDGAVALSDAEQEDLMRRMREKAGTDEI